MKENTYPPLTPDQIEAVANWLRHKREEPHIANVFKMDFSTPPEPEYIPGRWYYIVCGFKKYISRYDCVKDNTVNFLEGYDEDGSCYDRVVVTLPFDLSLATPEQIQHHLSLAAEKKGIRPGVKVTNKHFPVYHTLDGKTVYDKERDFLMVGKIIIYAGGKSGGSWAEIVQEEKAEQKMTIHPEDEEAFMRGEHVKLIPDQEFTGVKTVYADGKSTGTCTRDLSKEEIESLKNHPQVEKVGNEPACWKCAAHDDCYTRITRGSPPDYKCFSPKEQEEKTPKVNADGTFSTPEFDQFCKEATKSIGGAFTGYFVPPLPADGKWCVVITNYIQQNHFGIDVPGLRGNYYYSEVVNGSNFHGELLEGYTLISEEQFRRWVRGETNISNKEDQYGDMADTMDDLAKWKRAGSPPDEIPEKWCILRTPENAEMVNGWLNEQKRFGQPFTENTNYVTSKNIDNYPLTTAIPKGYTEISTEQFRVHVLGEKGVGFDHTIDLSHTSPFVKSGPNPAHDINTYPKEFKDAAENMRNEAAKVLLEDQPQHDQWEYESECTYENLVDDLAAEKSTNGWRPWAVYYVDLPNDKGEFRLCRVHFKRRKK